MFLREAVKFGAKAFGVELRHYPLFRRAIDLLLASGRKPFFIQIGANNGVDFDDFFSIVSNHDLPGIVVEPIPFYFDALTQAYKRHRQITPVRVALHPAENQAIIYRADPDKLTIGWQHGLGSFSREHLLQNQVPEDAIIAESVPCMSLRQLVENHVPEGQSVDILMSDTEGFDAEVIGMIDFDRVRPKVLKFEAKHLAPNTRADIEHRLIKAGLVIEKGGEDWVAVEAGLANRLRYLRTALRQPSSI